MKKYLLFLPFIALLVSLSSCEVTGPLLDVEPLPQCEGVRLSPDNVSAEYDIQWGTIREITVWETVPNAEVVTDPAYAISHTVWVILPDDNPDVILEPCNLPLDQMVENRRVTFTGQALNESPNSSGLEGFTPFNLIELSEGESEHEMDDFSC